MRDVDATFKIGSAAAAASTFGLALSGLKYQDDTPRPYKRQPKDKKTRKRRQKNKAARKARRRNRA